MTKRYVKSIFMFLKNVSILPRFAIHIIIAENGLSGKKLLKIRTRW